jgi:DNA (cytosine-5)-methyltransferase 1
MNDQSRASAWNVLRWCELLRVDRVLIENVTEFQSWGPLTTTMRPIAARKGETYRAFLAALASLGYAVETRVLNAADYGDATTRKRLFIQAVRGRGPIAWPKPTHSPRGGASLLRQTAPWRAAKEIIDWSLPSRSIFGRKKALAANTLKRIEVGIRRFGGRAFLLQQQSGGAPRLVSNPVPTITAAGAISLVEPFIVLLRGTDEKQIGRSALSIDEPLTTISAGGQHHALVEPFTMPYNSNGGDLARPISQPLGTITTTDRFALVIPDGMDIRLRMLQPHELSAATGFPVGYRFAGTKKDHTRQIGNAWACHTATALCRTLLAQHGSRDAARAEAIA